MGLRQWYHNLKLQTEVDPVALLALVISLATLSYTLLDHLLPHNLRIELENDRVTFYTFCEKKNEITKNYVNEFKSKFKSKCKSDEVGFIGLLAFFKFQNHRLSGATIDNIIANLIVRNDKSCYGWDDFVRSESQVDVLNIHTQDDASSFIVSRAMPLTSKEVKFSPAASDQANARYLHYMHDVRFFELINNDETPIVKFTILIDNGNDNQTIDLEYEVEDAQRIKNNFPAKQWTTQDVILKSSSNIKNVQRPNC